MTGEIDSMEKWKKIPNHDDYEASTHGRIRSIRPRKGSRANKNGGIVEGWKRISKHGNVICEFVSLRKDNKTYSYRKHRIILETFVGECPDGMEGCHNDGDATNNRIENLRWDTHENNIKDSIKHGTKTPPPIFYGESHHKTCLTADQIIDIRSRKIIRGTKAELARKYGTTQTTISRILKRQTWAHVA